MLLLNGMGKDKLFTFSVEFQPSGVHIVSMRGTKWRKFRQIGGETKTAGIRLQAGFGYLRECLRMLGNGLGNQNPRGSDSPTK